MSDLAILVPVLGRPHRVRPLLNSIRLATPDARVLFLPDPEDAAEREAIAANDAEELPVRGSYASKINAGVAHTTEPLIFTGADDLYFHRGWLAAATFELTEPTAVVGVNDLIRRRQGRRGHATHFLMTRSYAEQPTIDGAQGPMFCGYDHSFVDDELIATATHRGAYAYAGDALVEHQHFMNGTAPDDDTYRKGRAYFRRDQRMFLWRARLWT